MVAARARCDLGFEAELESLAAQRELRRSVALAYERELRIARRPVAPAQAPRRRGKQGQTRAHLVTELLKPAECALRRPSRGR